MDEPEVILKQLERAADNGYLTSDLIAQYQVEATLALTKQTKRIADILDSAMEVDRANPDAGRFVWIRDNG